MIDKISPGEEAPVTGIYINDTNGNKRKVRKGDKVPPTEKPGQKYIKPKNK